jgi:hypothetical protein
MAAAHLNTPPPTVESRRHDLDAEFAALIDRCLAKLPAERPSAEAVARALITEGTGRIEWPPPGLERLTGRGWRALNRAVTTEIFAIVVLAGSRWLTVLESPELIALTGAGLIVWFTFLMLSTGAASADAMTGLLRGLRAGYPKDVLIDAALDKRRDAGDLVNGLGVFALVPEGGRRTMIRARRTGAAALLIGAGVTGLLLGLWGGGWFVAGDVGLTLATAPLLVGWSMRWGMTLEERRVRIRATRETGGSWFASTPPIRGELVRGWLDGAGRNAPRAPTAGDRLTLEAWALPWLLLLGPLVALVLTIFAGWD